MNVDYCNAYQSQPATTGGKLQYVVYNRNVKQELQHKKKKKSIKKETVPNQHQKLLIIFIKHFKVNETEMSCS